MRLTIIIILAILAGLVAGFVKELFPALHNVPTLQLIILTAFVVGIIILLFQRARGTLHDDHWAKDQFKNKKNPSVHQQGNLSGNGMNANGWHYAEGGKTFGPVDLEELQVILSRISDPRNLLVWRVGFEGWQRAGDVPELAQLTEKPPSLPKTPEPDTVPERRGREWKWHFLQGTLQVLIVSAFAMSNVLWQWGLNNSVAGLLGVGAGWFLTVGLPRKLGRRVAIEAITLPILAVGLILLTYRYATIDDKEGLIGKTRSDFVESSVDACLKDPTANGVEASVLKEYCNCYSSTLADKISINELRSLAKKDQNTWLTAMQPKIDAAASACLPR